jgi:hypothetical protein
VEVEAGSRGGAGWSLASFRAGGFLPPGRGRVGGRGEARRGAFPNRTLSFPPLSATRGFSLYREGVPAARKIAEETYAFLQGGFPRGRRSFGGLGRSTAPSSRRIGGLGELRERLETPPKRFKTPWKPL